MTDIINMGKWEELRLVEQLVSLRHLPSNSCPPKLSHKPDVELITELLHLQNESDPFEWLKQNKNELISRVLLWISLTRIQSLVRSIERASIAGASTSFGNFKQWLGNLLQLPVHAEPFQKLIDSYPTTASSTLLQTVFQELRTLRGANGRKLITNNEIWLLLDDLFQLPSSSDPIRRIEDNHNHLAAVETLRYVLAQVQPPRDLLVGQTVTGAIVDMLHPKIRLEAESLTIDLQEVAVGKSSFALTLQTRVSVRTLPQDLSNNGIWLAWQGVERVTDDLGHHYLVCYRPEESGNQLQWFNQSLQLICYPAIFPTAKEITLRSSHMALVVMGTTPSEKFDKPKPLHQIQLGNPTWRIQVTK